MVILGKNSAAFPRCCVFYHTKSSKINILPRQPIEITNHESVNFSPLLSLVHLPLQGSLDFFKQETLSR